MRILCGTNWVSEDEPCLELFETDMQSPGFKGFHRYRVYRVMRGETETEFKEDLGLSENFKGVDGVFILGGIRDPITKKTECFYNAGQMREMADQYRNHCHFDKCELAQVDKVKVV